MPKKTNFAEDDNARLDEALKKFSGDFGGSADALTIAEELRQGDEMVKEVETILISDDWYSPSSSVWP